MKRFGKVAVVASAFLLSTVSAMAGWQLDLDGLYAHPTGSYADGENAKDFLDGGLGGRVTILASPSQSFGLGASIGYFSNSAADNSVDLSLRSLPIHGVVMWQTSGEGAVGFFVRGGAGMTRHSVNTNPNLSQSSFSWEAGAGMSFDFNDSWSLTGGASYTGASTGDSSEPDRVWDDGDNPKSWLFSVGMRWRSKSAE